MKKIFTKMKAVVLLVYVLSAVVTTTFAQSSANVSGTVIDFATGEAILGVSVAVEGTNKGATTNLDGMFNIKDVEVGSTIQLSYLGYKTQSFVYDGSLLNVELISDTKEIDEVVVVGFSTQKKANLTGAVSMVNDEVLKDRPFTQASQALQGMATGVYVNTTTGEPGNDTATITIRGVGSLNQSSQPLVIVDGIEGSIDNIAPSDIESISILKDAAAASIYGTRAAQGVILVTTKRGKFNAPTRFSYTGYGGLSMPTVLPDMVLDNRTYLEAYRVAADNSGVSHTITDADIDRYASMKSYDYADYTVDKSAAITSHEVSVSGGTEKVSFFTSAGYMFQDGWLKGNNNSTRYSVRSNVDAKLSDRLKMGTSVSLYIKNSNLTPKDQDSDDITATSNKGSLLFSNIVSSHPHVPIYTEDGYYAQQEQAMFVNTNRPNVQGVIDNETGTMDETGIIANGWLNYDIGHGFSVKALFGWTSDNTSTLSRKKEYTSYDFVTGEMQTDGNSLRNEGSELKVTNDKMQEITNQYFINYDRQFGAHDVKAFLGFNRQVREDNYSSIKETQFGSTDLVYLGYGTSVTSTGTLSDKSSLISLFARVNYSFDNKYLLEANIRRDASSRFSESNRWGTFPSFSGGWVISNEDFWSVEAVNNLKVRASWGLLGTEPTDRYGYRNQFALGENYVNQSGGAILVLGNDDLKWEQTNNLNIGADVNLFNNRLTLSGDYFIRKTSDILVELDNPLTAGVSGETTFNAASMENRGWELSGTYRTKITKDLYVGIGANVSNIQNKVTSIDSSLSADNDRLQVSSSQNVWWIRGESINAIYGLEYDGTFKSTADVDAAADHTYITGSNPEPGDMRFKDQNGDNVIDANDQIVLGARDPKWYYGFNLDVSFKNFDLSAMFQGVGDVYTYICREAGPFPFAGLRSMWLDAWSEDNADSDIPRLWVDRKGYNGATIATSGKQSSFWVENARYLRLKNLQVSYNVPTKICERFGIANTRVFVNGQNLLTFTPMKDFDPERNLLQNHSTATLPQSIIITAGVNLTF